MTSVIEWMDAWSREQPTRVYLRDARCDRFITYGAMVSLVRRWQADFDEHGPRVGGRIAILVSDPLDFAVVFLAVLTSGRHAVPLDPDAPPAETERALRHARPELVVTDRSIPAPSGVRELSPRMTLDPVPVGPEVDGGHGPVVGGHGPVVGGHLEVDDHGSVAEQGGVLLTGSAPAGPTTQVFLGTAQLSYVAATVARHHQLSRSDIGYNPLPLFHANALVVGLLATLYSGATLVLDRRFRRRGFWTMIGRHRVTWINGVPAILAILARDRDAVRARDCHVRFVRSAAAPLSVRVLQAFEEATGVPVLETYGMTEAGGHLTASPPAGTRKPGSVGVPVGSEVRIVDDTGTVLPAELTGKVQVRGPGVIRAYVGPDDGHRFTDDGWLDTGDIGLLDPDGYLFLSGRSDDVINRGGEKVLPREVEEVLLADPRVRRVTVVSRPDAVLGEVPVALVVPVDVPDPRLRTDLAERCEAGLTKFKRPTSIEIVADLPAAAGHTHAAA
ncbi:AMP-binding protein [Frankia sp. Cppng1_Ct_nod]|uniref:AMP-binding protein n=1 Tax=Frankia sp. Cppng1_Ct_nod TaxID=2897162 RepID=UPI001040E2ED|nr:AMP-binding protein [Frankia sp. Cppng1_Ct_nod]